MRMLFLLLVLALGILAFIAAVLFGVWVYFDAKSRRLNAPLWTAVAFLTPCFLGLLLYLLIGRREAAAVCPHCGKLYPFSARQCPNCGGDVPAYKNAGEGLLIAFFCVIGAAALIFISFVIYVMFRICVYNYGLRYNKWRATSLLENQIGSRWDLSFNKLDGVKSSGFVIRNGKPDSMKIDSVISGGTVTIELTQGSYDKNVALPGGNSISTVDLTGFEDGRVTVRVNADNAKGSIRMDWQ